MVRRLALPVALAVSAGALAAPVATPAGPPVDCVELNQIDHTEVRDDRTVDFVLRGRGHPVYRNVLPQSCPELGFERAFGYETSLSRLCNVDIITVLRQSGPDRRGASCGLGQFQPVTLSGR